MVTNPMSVSVPNLACSDTNNTLEPAAATGLLETFAAMARRRTLGQFMSNNACKHVFFVIYIIHKIM